MKQNKGQVLVLFLLLLPIFLLLFVSVIETGKIYIEKRKLDTTIYEACKYALKHKEDDGIVEKVKKIIYKNQPDIDWLDVQISDDVNIRASKTYQPVLPLLNKNYQIKSKYHGIKNEEKYNIKKE